MPDTSSSRSRVAFIFVLLLASANLVSATNDDADSPTKQVMDYNVEISESGEQFNQTIEVDTERQTVLFKVPAHNNVDHSNILHDFKMNLSMLMLPEEKICYLLPLDKEILAPRKLLSDLDNAEKPINTKKIINKWTIGAEMADRSVLSDELANFCSKYTIYNVKNMDDSLTTTRIQTGGKKTRQRRVLVMKYKVIPRDDLCSGAVISVPSPDDEVYCVFERNKKWKVRCLIESETCYYIDVCETTEKCYRKHFMNSIICCKYVCI